MPLFLLSLKDCSKYDQAHGFVVRAADATAARRTVAAEADDDNGIGPGGEGRDAWTNPYESTCCRIPEDGPTEIILRDFNPG